MLIKATATFKIDDMGDDGFKVEAGQYVDLRNGVASIAISQGAAVRAMLEEVRLEAAAKAAAKTAMKVDIPAADEAIKPSKKLKSNDAQLAKE